MAGNTLLLDTNIVTAYFGGDRVVLERLQGSEVYLSIITVGELLYGAYRSQRCGYRPPRARHQRSGYLISFGPWPSLDRIDAWRQRPEFKAFFGRARELCESIEPHTLKELAAVGGRE